MSDRGNFLICKTFFALLVFFLLAGDAAAYVVPGVGPDFFAQFISLIVWLVVAFSSVLLWPVYALLRRFRGRGATVVPACETAKAEPVPADRPVVEPRDIRLSSAAPTHG